MTTDVSAGQVDRLVRRLDVCDGMEIPVEYVVDLPELGHWSESENIVRIRANQPHCGKVIVLMHEMLHMAESQMIASGILGMFYNWVIRPLWGEILVEHLSSFMFQWMSRSCMLNPQMVDRAEAIEFMTQHMESHPQSVIEA